LKHVSTVKLYPNKAIAKLSIFKDMANPGTAYDTPALGKDPQPANYEDLYTGDDDEAGVHINSGIPNRAFYLASIDIGGNAYDIPGKIWYAVMTGGELPFATADIPLFASLTRNYAKNMYDSTIADYIEQAWNEVGVNVPG
jgi:Zn-dependent metalloprotease